MRISNDGPEVFSSYASHKSRSEITVWMPWPLNRNLRGRAKWPSNHFRLHVYTARYIMYSSTGNVSSMHVWLAGYPFFSRWNAKSQIRSLVCTLRNSNIAIASLVCTLRNSKWAFRIKIQNTHYASCENRFGLCTMSIYFPSGEGDYASTSLYLNCALIMEFQKWHGVFLLGNWSHGDNLTFKIFIVPSNSLAKIFLYVI